MISLKMSRAGNWTGSYVLQKQAWFWSGLYSSSATNQIVPIDIDPIVGASYMKINAGEITNKGIEVSVNATPVKTKNFTWDVSANWQGILTDSSACTKTWIKACHGKPIWVPPSGKVTCLFLRRRGNAQNLGLRLKSSQGFLLPGR
jgi:outer membrane receptor protein involved in Fe transport